MPKKLFQDMVKVNSVKSKVPQGAHSVDFVGATSNELKPKQGKIRSRYSLWIVALISVLVLFFALAFLFSNAKVVVNPKIRDLVLNENLSATKNTSTDNLPFDLVVISGEENKNIQGVDMQDLALKAKGIVLIYNAFSASAQSLAIDTKLEGSNGKSYKTKTKVIVPGMKKDGTPGSVAVEIYGALAGEEYNSVPIDFKIFSFKGTPKYSKIYARSKEAITGGFKGKSRVVSDDQKATVINELKTILQNKLLKKATDQIPNGFILFKDAIYLNIDEASVDFFSPGDQVPAKVKGTLYGFLFNEKKLTKKIVEQLFPSEDVGDVYIQNIKNLTFSFANKESLSTPAEIQDISFNLSGHSKLVSKIDENKLLTDILGKSKTDFDRILSQYPNIASANLVLSPFWKSSLPENTKNIQILVNYPQ